MQKLLAVITLWAWSLSAHAQAKSCSPTPETNPDNQSLTLISNIFGGVIGSDFFKTFIASGLTMSTGLKTTALTLAGGLTLVAIAWTVIKGMVSKDEIGATLAIHLAVGIVVAMLINQYAQVVGFFVWIEESALTAVGNSPWSALAGLFSGVLKSIVAGFKMVGDTYSCLGIMSSGLFAALADALLAMIIYFAALVLLLYAIVELLTVVVVAPVIAGIGVAFGPLLIAALANEWSRSWFVTWVKFLLSALMIWVVLTATLQLLTTSFLSVSQQWFGDAKGTLSGQALGMAILMVCVGKIFSAVPAITDGLMGAKTGASAANVGGRGFAAAATAALATTAAALGATRSGVSAAGGATMAGATAGAAAQQGAKAAWESFTKSMGAMRGK